MRYLECSQCDGFKEQIMMVAIRQYFNIVEELIELLDQGSFSLVMRSLNIKRLKRDTPWEEYIRQHHYGSHVFKCTSCGCVFVLWARHIDEEIERVAWSASWNWYEVPPIEIKRMIAEYRAEKDIISAFIEECCVNGKELRVRSIKISH